MGQSDGSSGDGSESSEWVELARELRASDPSVHAQALRTVRGIAAALRARRRHDVFPGALFSTGKKPKPSA